MERASLLHPSLAGPPDSGWLVPLQRSLGCRILVNVREAGREGPHGDEQFPFPRCWHGQPFDSQRVMIAKTVATPRAHLSRRPIQHTLRASAFRNCLLYTSDAADE